jgi:hypothetical protein
MVFDIFVHSNHCSHLSNTVLQLLTSARRQLPRQKFLPCNEFSLPIGSGPVAFPFCELIALNERMDRFPAHRTCGHNENVARRLEEPYAVIELCDHSRNGKQYLASAMSSG